MHDFLLLYIKDLPDEFPFSADEYNYYKRIEISDKFIINNNQYLSYKFAAFNSFWWSMNNPQIGLNYYGVTIFDYDCILELSHTLTKLKSSDERNKLIEICDIAIDRGMYLIHLGI